MAPDDRQFPDFYISQYGRLRRLGFLTGDWGEGEELLVVREAIRRLPTRRASIPASPSRAATR